MEGGRGRSCMYPGPGPRTQDPGLQDSRTPGPQDPRTSGPQDPRTPGPPDTRTPGPRHRGPQDPRIQDPRTPGPQDPGTQDPRTQDPGPRTQDQWQHHTELRRLWQALWPATFVSTLCHTLGGMVPPPLLQNHTCFDKFLWILMHFLFFTIYTLPALALHFPFFTIFLPVVGVVVS